MLVRPVKVIKYHVAHDCAYTRTLNRLGSKLQNVLCAVKEVIHSKLLFAEFWILTVNFLQVEYQKLDNLLLLSFFVFHAGKWC